MFFWENSETRYPLAAGSELWLPILHLVNKTGRDHFASLEFVENNATESFFRDAQVLKDWIGFLNKKYRDNLDKHKNRIILVGMKSCGKLSVGKILSSKLNIDFVDQDAELEKRHFEKMQESLTYREIYKKYGDAYFRDLETETLDIISSKLLGREFVLATGGATPIVTKNQSTLKKMGLVVYLDMDKDILLDRMKTNGVPAILPNPDRQEMSLSKLVEERIPVYRNIADIIMQCGMETVEDIASSLAIRVGSQNYVD